MFKDRKEAGQKLTDKLKKYQNQKDTLVLAIPRGGVVVALEIAKGLNLPLDIVVVRKIGAPQDPEFAIGAVDEEGNIVKNLEVEVSKEYLAKEAQKEKEEIKRRLKEYRGNKKEPDLEGKTIILVDDGIATGLTTIAAINFLKLKKTKEIILATPVIAKDALEKIKGKALKVYYLAAPELFFAVGQFYDFFPQTEDLEVKNILAEF